MLPGESLAGAKHSQSSPRSQKFPSARLVCGIACAVILVCIAASPELRAQVTCVRPSSADAASAQPAEISASDSCSGAHLKPTLDCAKKTSPDNNEDGTKAALACEWINTDEHGLGNALYSLTVLTCNTKDPDVRKSDVCLALKPADLQGSKVLLTVKALLTKGAPHDENLYAWALGDPDSDGKPRGTAMANFTDILASVNTLTAGGKKRSTDEQGLFKDELFECTTTLIKQIYEDGKRPGPILLARIHDTFVKNKLNLALIQLLDAEIQFLKNHDIAPAKGSQNIEKFRAAFEIDSKRLAAQVADKINSSQQ